MSERENVQFETFARDAGLAASSPMITSNMVMEATPGFAAANMMISASLANSRAMEASVAHINQTYMTGLATTTQCVTRILEDPTRATLLNAFIAASRD